jgi:hypothetical protein
MAIDRRAWKAGRITFPIFPIILVIGTLAVIISLQLPKKVVTVSNYTLDGNDIRATKILDSGDAQKVDFIVYLTSTGSKHVATWESANPSSVISIAYGDRLMGKLSLSPTMNTSTLHLAATPDVAITARYVIGK